MLFLKLRRPLKCNFPELLPTGKFQGGDKEAKEVKEAIATSITRITKNAAECKVQEMVRGELSGDRTLVHPQSFSGLVGILFFISFFI